MSIPIKTKFKLKIPKPSEPSEPSELSEPSKPPEPSEPSEPSERIDLRTLNLNNNDIIVDVMEQLIKYIKSIPDPKNTFRIKQFKKAIDSMQSCPCKIISGSWAKKNLDGVGDGVAKRIDEILKTGTLAELSSHIEEDQQTSSLNNLMTVHGIGIQMAKKLYSQGITDVQMLSSSLSSSLSSKSKFALHNDVLVGLKWYNDLNQKIPYNEVAMINRRIIDILSPYKNLLITVCGSHRRLAAFSGDIDVLMTDLPKESKESKESKKVSLQEIVKTLTDNGLIVDHLTIDGTKKFMGICSIEFPEKSGNRVGRRIDIRLVNYTEYAPALLYFTGSMWINKQMRIIAMQKGLKLNEYALLQGDKPLPVSSEEDIFRLLNIVYLTPQERDISA